MPRTNLNLGLQELQTLITQIGAGLHTALGQILTSLVNGEQQALSPLIGNNDSINTLCVEAEKRSLRLLILQQPLGGQDMRFLTATLYISYHLREIGNSIVEIVRNLMQAASLYYQADNASVYSITGNSVDQQGNLTDVIILRGLLSLGKEFEYLLVTAMEAFAKRDSISAQTIQTESLVELRYIPIYEDIIKMHVQSSASLILQKDAAYVQRMTCLLWVAHKLAEMATHVTNIAKRIIYIVEG